MSIPRSNIRISGVQPSAGTVSVTGDTATVNMQQGNLGDLFRAMSQRVTTMTVNVQGGSATTPKTPSTSTATQPKTSEPAMTSVAAPTQINWLLLGGIAVAAWLLFSGKKF